MSGVRPIADPFELERALRRAEEDLAALRAAARDVVASWKDPGADGRSPWGSLIELEKVLDGQGGMPTAVAYHDADGTHYSATPGMRFLSISELTARDRVFQVSALISHAEIDRLIGDSRIGRIGDMPGTEARIRARLAGEASPKGPVLAVVKGDGE
jgi:hypothetical protein